MNTDIFNSNCPFGAFVVGALFIGSLVTSCVSADVATERIYLSGKGPSDAIEWKFHCSDGRNHSKWTTIPVPSNWEQYGFGSYNYGYTLPDEKLDEVGTYRTSFMVPDEWKDRHVRLVFEGAMTETTIRVNGQSVGARNQGGYLPFRYPLNGKHFRGRLVPPVLKYGELNELEVRVAERPSNHSLNVGERSADYWVFGGIYRPVYIEVLPLEFIDRAAIDARASGDIRVEVFPQSHTDIKTKEIDDLDAYPVIDMIEAQVLTHDGEIIGAPFYAAIPGPVSSVLLETQIDSPALWTPETPRLYDLRLRLMKGGEVVHERFDTFGFRTIELKTDDGLYLNGEKILIRGVNRNGLDVNHARAIDPDTAWDDVRMIKSMNANLVRSHLPPSRAFMEACDQLGLLVMSELSTWKYPVIDSPVARNLAYSLVTTYHNYPSYIMWANGNEGGFNRDIDPIFEAYDLQGRPVIHPWAVFNGINALHYPSYDQLQQALDGPWVVLLTEFLHGLFDGGHGAGLADFWNLMRGSKKAAGGVLWCWADAGISRTDQGGMIDTDGNYSADGIVGPNREKEASFYAIREIWSPLRIELESISGLFDGSLNVENLYDFRNLNTCTLYWKLVRYSSPFAVEAVMEVSAQGSVQFADISPGEAGTVRLPLPENWRDSDALLVSVDDMSGMEIGAWSWPVKIDTEYFDAEDSEYEIVEIEPMKFKVGDLTWEFSEETGMLIRSSIGDQITGLGAGPVLYSDSTENALPEEHSWLVSTRKVEGAVIIESSEEGSDSSFRWVLTPDGGLELSYSFLPPSGALGHCAVGFELAEDLVQSKRWLGDGPFRIWSNRRTGVRFGLWENAYNDTVPGVNWEYPAFKGVFGDVDWMSLNLNILARLVIEPAGLMDVGVLRPSNANDNKSRKNRKYGPVQAVWTYPEEGGLFFFSKTPAIGTKLNAFEDLGPQSQRRELVDQIEGRISFRFLSGLTDAP